MPGKKSTKEKKRKHSHSEGRHDVDRKRRSTESSIEMDFKEDNEHQEADEPSDIEEGGLDLSVPFKPISAFVADRSEMLEQCFRVLGENKLKKMLPDELKSCTFDEIKRLCWEQLEQLSQSNLLQILEGEDVTGTSDTEDVGNRKKSDTDSQQDNNVDSTSSLKENVEMEDLKQGGGSGEEGDVLSINADTYDSDIEGIKEEVAAAGSAEVLSTAPPAPAAAPQADTPRPADPKKELQKDIEKSVSEILASAAAPTQEEPNAARPQPALAVPEPPAARMATATATPLPTATGTAPLSGPAPKTAQPSAQQLELLELEMRARAIKALMKANEVKKQACT